MQERGLPDGRNVLFRACAQEELRDLFAVFDEARMTGVEAGALDTSASSPSIHPTLSPGAMILAVELTDTTKGDGLW